MHNYPEANHSNSSAIPGTTSASPVPVASVQENAVMGSATANSNRTPEELVVGISSKGSHHGTLKLSETRILVGSANDCTVCLRSSKIQPQQCLISRGSDRAFVRSLHETTLLNGKPFTEQWLAEGDRISCGPVDVHLIKLGFNSVTTGHSDLLSDNQQLTELKARTVELRGQLEVQRQQLVSGNLSAEGSLAESLAKLQTTRQQIDQLLNQKPQAAVESTTDVPTPTAAPPTNEQASEVSSQDFAQAGLIPASNVEINAELLDIQSEFSSDVQQGDGESTENVADLSDVYNMLAEEQLTAESEVSDASRRKEQSDATEETLLVGEQTAADSVEDSRDHELLTSSTNQLESRDESVEAGAADVAEVSVQQPETELAMPESESPVNGNAETIEVEVFPAVSMADEADLVVEDIADAACDVQNMVENQFSGINETVETAPASMVDEQLADPLSDDLPQVVETEELDVEWDSNDVQAVEDIVSDDAISGSFDPVEDVIAEEVSVEDAAVQEEIAQDEAVGQTDESTIAQIEPQVQPGEPPVQSTVDRATELASLNEWFQQTTQVGNSLPETEGMASHESASIMNELMTGNAAGESIVAPEAESVEETPEKTTDEKPGDANDIVEDRADSDSKTEKSSLPQHVLDLIRARSPSTEETASVTDLEDSTSGHEAMKTQTPTDSLDDFDYIENASVEQAAVERAGVEQATVEESTSPMEEVGNVEPSVVLADLVGSDTASSFDSSEETEETASTVNPLAALREGIGSFFDATSDTQDSPSDETQNLIPNTDEVSTLDVDTVTNEPSNEVAISKADPLETSVHAEEESITVSETETESAGRSSDDFKQDLPGGQEDDSESPLNRETGVSHVETTSTEPSELQLESLAEGPESNAEESARVEESANAEASDSETPADVSSDSTEEESIDESIEAYMERLLARSSAGKQERASFKAADEPVQKAPAEPAPQPKELLAKTFSKEIEDHRKETGPVEIQPHTLPKLEESYLDEMRQMSRATASAAIEASHRRTTSTKATLQLVGAVCLLLMGLIQTVLAGSFSTFSYFLAIPCIAGSMYLFYRYSEWQRSCKEAGFMKNGTASKDDAPAADEEKEATGNTESSAAASENMNLQTTVDVVEVVIPTTDETKS